MAVGAFKMYKSFQYRAMRDAMLGESNIAGTLKAALLDNAHTPSLTAHSTWNDVSGDECADGDYAEQTITGLAIGQDGSSNTTIDANDVDFGNAVTISARYLVLYYDTGTPTTSYLVGITDLNDGGAANVSSTADDFDISWPAGGFYTITPAT